MITARLAGRQPGRDRPPGLPHLPASSASRPSRSTPTPTPGCRSCARPTSPCACRATRRPRPTCASTSSLEAARRAGADAIHPGYGFLSENADFARAVIDAGLTWVGPTPESIEPMGSKVEAKKLMARRRRAGAARLPDAADRGRPAAAGQGVRRRRRPRHARRPRASPTSPPRSRRREAEAASAFGDGTVFVEPYVERGRHVEVQVVGDRTATCWCSASATARSSAGTRRSSRRRRRPASPSEIRARAARRRARGGRGDRLRGAGTVEFLYDAGDRAVLVPGDEHPAPGRAPGHRAGATASTWSSCSSPSPRARPGRLGSAPTPPRGPRDRGAAVRRGPGGRLPAAERRADARSRSRLGERRHPASTPASRPATRSRPTTTRCSPRSIA